ncbi:MAG: hypothetical protein KC548_06300 [Nanoarchaeota archaeon]|nr:hypothetical protein [Nanoarchaeota archaeon]
MKIIALGGVSTTAKNMVAFEFESGRIVVCDMGLDSVLMTQIKSELPSFTYEELLKRDLVADMSYLLERRDKVAAIVLSNALPDHCGAVPYLAKEFSCPIYATKFTCEVLKLQGLDKEVESRLKKVDINSSFATDFDDLKVEFINVTHAVPESSILALHTKEGIILYAQGFKFDNRPALGLKPHYDRLKVLEKRGIKLAVVDSLKSNEFRKTMSEVVVKEMLRDVFIETDIVQTQGVIITTFPSHITRLKSIMELTLESNRKLVFLGEELALYAEAAKKAGLIDFVQKGTRIVSKKEDILKELALIEKQKENFVIVCTGHQGEKDGVLTWIAAGETAYKVTQNDKVVFSSDAIPVDGAFASRQTIEKKFESTMCKVFNDMHVSGHGSREDLRDFLTMTHPKIVVPSRGDVRQKEGMIELCEELGLEEGHGLLLLNDGQTKDI